MKVKKYTAPTMPDAMKQVRKELGEAAVILNSKEKNSRGLLGLFKKKSIEVIAAVDPQPIKQSPKTSLQKEKEFKRSSFAIKDSQPDKSVKTDQELLNEIRELKAELNQTEGKKNYPSPLDSIYLKLEKQGISHKLINEMMDDLLTEYYSNGKINDSSHYMKMIKNILYEKLQDATDFKLSEHIKTVYLFGPTGVGKTTTVAKLAADQAINQGKNVGLITLDTYRIAAVEQLKTYAKILGLPVEVAYNKDDFERAREKFSDQDLILVDTAGRNFKKDEYINQMKQFVNFTEEDALFCVLSLTTKEQDLKEIYSRFHDLSVNNVILTKIDETSQYGPIINLWDQYQFKIAYLTTGQDVPNDIERPTSKRLTDMIAGETR
ncbi:flagellar biosynthesis protein FlhF [Alkalibacillus silvisoli]|uniref:Flagellar biosynthesis protein FlhF n=1 Tax=Alkalibacillus silvisoli TaxID=392823 RepID=A0ABN0ZWH3_9BACI